MLKYHQKEQKVDDIMYFYNLITELSKEQKIKLFVDMDGVISSYDFGKPLNFKTKRPLKTNIKVLKKVSKLENVELHILSVCRKNTEIKDKNNWLNQYAPFFKKENRHILSKEKYPNLTSGNLKKNFLKEYHSDNQIVLVDDDNQILREIKEETKNIILLQDSELID